MNVGRICRLPLNPGLSTGYKCLMPPSTTSSIPVLRLLSSDARKATTLAISSGVALAGIPGGRSFESIYPAFSTMNFAATTVFEVANQNFGSAAYEVVLVSEDGGPVATSLGYEIQTSSFKRRTFDTIVIAGGMNAPAATPGLLNYLRSAVPRTRRIALICGGAWILAEAGLLDGRRATTHWQFARSIQRLYPKIQVEKDRIFTTDGPIWTSAGMSAGVDVALALVENDLGAALARAVAKTLVVYHRRAGGQSQYSTLLDLDAKSDRVQTAIA
jgi:transcriptional regulator GlxA family with amidase domain